MADLHFVLICKKNYYALFVHRSYISWILHELSSNIIFYEMSSGNDLKTSMMLQSMFGRKKEF